MNVKKMGNKWWWWRISYCRSCKKSGAEVRKRSM